MKNVKRMVVVAAVVVAVFVGRASAQHTDTASDAPALPYCSTLHGSETAYPYTTPVACTDSTGILTLVTWVAVK